METKRSSRPRIAKSLFVLFIPLTWVVLAASAHAADLTIEEPQRSRVCMMQDTIMAVPAIPLVRDGKTYYGCCEMCKAKIAAEPARYTLARDPLSGKVVDKAVASLLSVNGRVLYFESDVTRARFRESLGAK